MKRTVFGLVALAATFAVTVAQDAPRTKTGEPPSAEGGKNSQEAAVEREIAGLKSQIAFHQKRLDYWKEKKDAASAETLQQWERQLGAEKHSLANFERSLKTLAMEREFAEKFPELQPKGPARGGFGGDRGGFGGERGSFGKAASGRAAPVTTELRTIEEKLDEILRRLDGPRGGPVQGDRGRPQYDQFNRRPQEPPARRTTEEKLDEVLRRLESVEERLERMEQRPASKGPRSPRF